MQIKTSIMKKIPVIPTLFLLVHLAKTGICSVQPDELFRVYPYLLAPSSTGVYITWFTESPQGGTLKICKKGSTDTVYYDSKPKLEESLGYSQLEESQRDEFPDMFSSNNYKHFIEVNNLEPDTRYHYQVVQGKSRYDAHLNTAPESGGRKAIKFITYADSETDPAGRSIKREWKTGPQHPKSNGRPDTLQKYLVTETQGYIENLKTIKKRDPDFILLSGDIVQGGGYQRAWDEFFFHNAGKFDNPLSFIPLLPAIGNWENYGARNGKYQPHAIKKSRAKYKSYFEAPPNNNPNYKNFYYRIDYGPVTILTLDSSNGLPDSTNKDTNVNINADEYPGNDLPDINPDSDQWIWTLNQLKQAHSQGQIIFVQFHHIPYSSGGHSLPMKAKGSSGQAGIPMRIYTPYFKKYDVTAVFCGHNESFEHSTVDGIHFYDAGVGGDGFGYSLAKRDNRFKNPYQVWTAHFDAPELWKGKQLVDGGKHYGHLEIFVQPMDKNQFKITFTPVYIFPVTDSNGQVTSFERRVYDDVETFKIEK